MTTSFTERVRTGATVYGAWLTVPHPLSGRSLAAAGLDFVVIDLQHGGATEADLPGLTSAIRQAGAAPLGRVRYAHPADIGRALDLGCDGVIVPNVDSSRQAREVVRACRYPPDGDRSAGGVMAGGDPLCVIMVESIQAMQELPETLKVPGVDGIFVGPRDLSFALGCAFDPDNEVLRSALEKIWAACATAGRPVGVHATDGTIARRYAGAGCRLVVVASDALAIARTAAANLTAARTH